MTDPADDASEGAESGKTFLTTVNINSQRPPSSDAEKGVYHYEDPSEPSQQLSQPYEPSDIASTNRSSVNDWKSVKQELTRTNSSKVYVKTRKSWYTVPEKV